MGFVVSKHFQVSYEVTTHGVKSTVCYKVEDYYLCLRNPHDFKKRNFWVSLRTFPGDPSAIESALSDSAIPAILPKCTDLCTC